MDGVTPNSFGAFFGLFRILHERGGFEIYPGYRFFVGYPLLPCIGLLAIGLGFGQAFRWNQPERRRLLLRAGLGMTVAFLILRFGNLYGDPRPWTIQGNLVDTLLAFINCQKYPFSLCYVLMTMGPILILLAAVDGLPADRWAPIQLFGRVPLFYYLLHLVVLHGLAIFIHFFRTGRADFLYGHPRALPPSDAGLDLPSVYVIWLASVVLLYPICRSFETFRQTRVGFWTRLL